MQKMLSLGSIGSSGRLSTEENIEEHEETLSSFQAREEEIERKIMEVRNKVQLQLGRAEEETRRLAHIWEELEVMADPMRKDVANFRKKIDIANRELKSIGHTCQKKEKEYKEALQTFDEKNLEKTQLVTTLVELLAESERLRMQKLEELSKNIELLQLDK
ncbi:uncharacterized protein LOC107433850 [Ziziphus jujuba]|uniref:Uncharacterized protein LOC107433850 n=2 Tax=Ziziphus jujuba TaxID=326968 RepID=A0A6P4AUB0_ZIZJJ|nr:uncharacterized protein LOC107433850 [Ziziphus jujuba]KAH7545604.1 hypothetical protein FEM48_Zijuj01G0111000 [Ziziphus jujuba var. spinosa]